MQATTRDVSAWYPQVIRKHRTWHSSFPLEYAHAWKELFDTDPEAGVFEACVRELLEQHTDRVEPAQERDVGGPDFLCTVGQERFYVVAACLMMDAVSEHTGLPADLELRARTYRDLTALIRNEMMSKQDQCSGLDAPCLLAVGTYPFGGEHPVRRRAARAERPRFDDQAPMAMDSDSGRAASGILVCGFGCRVWRRGWPVRGVLHPAAVRPFRREWLAGVRFCELERGPEKNSHRVKWG